jgi:hypothetical protein
VCKIGRWFFSRWWRPSSSRPRRPWTAPIFLPSHGNTPSLPLPLSFYLSLSLSLSLSPSVSVNHYMSTFSYYEGLPWLHCQTYQFTTFKFILTLFNLSLFLVSCFPLRYFIGGTYLYMCICTTLLRRKKTTFHESYRHLWWLPDLWGKPGTKSPLQSHVWEDNTCKKMF